MCKKNTKDYMENKRDMSGREDFTRKRNEKIM